MDIISKLVDKFKNSNKKQIECKKLYKKYLDICIKNNEPPISEHYFGRKIKGRLFRKKAREGKKLIWVYVPVVPDTVLEISPTNKVMQELKDSINNMDDLLEHIKWLNEGLCKRIKKALENDQSW